MAVGPESLKPYRFELQRQQERIAREAERAKEAEVRDRNRTRLAELELAVEAAGKREEDRFKALIE
jgi:hypothetical protein